MQRLGRANKRRPRRRRPFCLTPSAPCGLVRSLGMVCCLDKVGADLSCRRPPGRTFEVTRPGRLQGLYKPGASPRFARLCFRSPMSLRWPPPQCCWSGRPFRARPSLFHRPRRLLQAGGCDLASHCPYLIFTTGSSDSAPQGGSIAFASVLDSSWKAHWGPYPGPFRGFLNGRSLDRAVRRKLVQ